MIEENQTPGTNPTDPGSRVGVLMLDTRFPRLPGDIGNRESWNRPVVFEVVRGASPQQAVRHQAEGLLEPFLEAGRRLVSQNVAAITTSCGFLVLFQNSLEAELGVPVITSSLLEVPKLDAALGAGKRAGILTIASSSLSAAHLKAAGISEDIPVGTTEHGREFTRAILQDEETFNPVLAEEDNVTAASKLKAAHPEIGAIVLECTNMGAYAGAIRKATGVPVISIVDVVEKRLAERAAN